jgi:hypothetical protein
MELTDDRMTDHIDAGSQRQADPVRDSSREPRRASFPPLDSVSIPDIPLMALASVGFLVPFAVRMAPVLMLVASDWRADTVVWMFWAETVVFGAVTAFSIAMRRDDQGRRGGSRVGMALAFLVAYEGFAAFIALLCSSFFPHISVSQVIGGLVMISLGQGLALLVALLYGREDREVPVSLLVLGSASRAGALYVIAFIGGMLGMMLGSPLPALVPLFVLDFLVAAFAYAYWRSAPKGDVVRPPGS